MNKPNKIEQVKNDYVEFILKQAKEKDLPTEEIVDIIRETWLYFKPDGTVKSE